MISKRKLYWPLHNCKKTALLALLVALFAVLLASVPGVPRFIDEDLNLLEALKIFHRHQAFLAGITTGWPVLFLTGLATTITKSLYGSRVIMAILALGFFYVWHKLAERYGLNDWERFFGILILTTIPNFNSLSIQLLGEAPASMLAFGAIWAGMSGAYLFAGALAALTFTVKTIFLPFLIFAAFAAFLVNRQAFKKFALGAAAVLVATEIGAAFKMGWERYLFIRSLTVKFILVFIKGGERANAAKDAAIPFFTRLTQKLELSEFRIHARYVRAIYAVVFTSGIGFGAAEFFRAWKKKESARYFLVAGLFFAAALVAWWFLLNEPMWYRHVFPGIAVGLGCALLPALSLLRKRNVFAFLFLAFWLVKTPQHLWNFTYYARQPEKWKCPASVLDCEVPPDDRETLE